MSNPKKKNSSRVNLILSVVFHTALVLALGYFAAREGMLGKRLKQITVTMVPKEKKPEPPKEKPAPPKLEAPKMAETPRPAIQEPPKSMPAAPARSEETVSVAPAAVSLPAFEFNDGAHDVQTASDPAAIYKGLVELALRSRWNRPENLHDDRYVAEVELTVGADGTVEKHRWISGSGDTRWDDSVKAAVAKTANISRPPPNGFPSTFTVRFDVESSDAGDGLQLSVR
jgi:TonB family protein